MFVIFINLDISVVIKYVGLVANWMTWFYMPLLIQINFGFKKQQYLFKKEERRRKVRNIKIEQKRKNKVLFLCLKRNELLFLLPYSDKIISDNNYLLNKARSLLFLPNPLLIV